MVSTGTQTSTDDLRLPSRSPSSSGALPVAPLPNRKVDAASSASTSGQGLTPPAPPATSTPKGRGLPPRTSAPQRKPGEPPKQSTSKGQLPAATDEPMDESGLRSEEDAPLSGSESSLSVANSRTSCRRRRRRRRRRRDSLGQKWSLSPGRRPWLCMGKGKVSGWASEPMASPSLVSGEGCPGHPVYKPLHAPRAALQHTAFERREASGLFNR
ncbi:hypothetical protein ISCGN_021289 [Ixodes scapularis]